jgi:hypothetical protein
MGLSFLAPLFFAGLVALAIPVLIHLTHRQKATVVPFPSLMFVQKVPFKSMRRQKIRHWMLFLLRCAALVLLVLAFARPFFTQASIAATLSGASREVVILLDNSHSMSYGDRWERATREARRVIAGLTPSDRASLVVFSDAAQLAVRSTPEPSVLIGTLDVITPTRRGTRYAPAVGIAQQLLSETDQAAREVVLITDYQKAGWDAEQAAQLPEGTNLIGIDVADEESSNLSVVSLILQRESAEQGEQVAVSARLVNQGPDPVEGLEAILEIEGERVDARAVSLEPNSAVTVSFASQPLSEAALRGIVRAGTDSLPEDNAFYFMINPGGTLSVLLLTNPRGHATDTFFFERALGVGTRPAFRVRSKPSSDFRAADLAGVSAVVIADAPYPSGAAGRDLRAWVEAGGGLFVSLGELTRPDGWQGGDAGALVPPFGDELVDRYADLGGALASYDRNHPIFEVFRTPRSGDFTAASFDRYWRLEPGETDVVAAGFDDGNPALVARTVGAGRVVVLPTTLDRFWNDLARQPVFVPFMHRVVQYAAGYQEAVAWQTVGGVLRLGNVEGVELAPGTTVEVGSPAGGVVSLVAAAEPSTTADPVTAPDRLDLEEPGFYELRWNDGASDQVARLAANLDRAESDLSRIDPEELASALSWRGGARNDLELAGAVTAEDREARQSFWWYLLVLVFIVLLAESVLSNRLSPSSATRAT